MMEIRDLEKSGAITFLITLYEHGGSMQVTDLLYTTRINSQTFYARKKDLMNAGFISQEGKIIDRDGKAIKTTIITLTPKGRKVAEKLAEIKKIIEEKR